MELTEYDFDFRNHDGRRSCRIYVFECRPTQESNQCLRCDYITRCCKSCELAEKYMNK